MIITKGSCLILLKNWRAKVAFQTQEKLSHSSEGLGYQNDTSKTRDIVADNYITSPQNGDKLKTSEVVASEYNVSDATIKRDAQLNNKGTPRA